MIKIFLFRLTPLPATPVRNRLTLGKRKRRDETPPTPRSPPPQPTPATPSFILSTPTPPLSRPVTPTPSPPVRLGTSPCACCGIEKVQLKTHVRNTEVCLKFYKDQYNNQDIHRIFDIIKNQKKQAKRRIDRENGIPRADHANRGNNSIRTQKKLFCQKITSLFEKRCVFCKRYTGFETIELRDVGTDVDVDISSQFEGCYWICKLCKSIKDTLLHGECVLQALADVEVRSLEEMKKIVGLVEYVSGEYIQPVLLPIIGEVDFQFIDDQTKLEEDAHALVFEHMCSMKNKEAISAERINHFSQVGHYDAGVLLDTMYR